MARNEGGPGPGVTKGKTPEDHAEDRATAKRRKQARKGGKGMHAATLADSARESELVLAENRLADAFDMALAAIEEFAAHTLRDPNKGTTYARHSSSTTEGMTALLCWLFDDTEENTGDMEARPIYGQPIQTVRKLFVFACEMHNLRKSFQGKYDWYSTFSQDKLLRREVRYRRNLLQETTANAA
jgi:hypothetical protein